MRYSITYSLKRLGQILPAVISRTLICNLLLFALLILPSGIMGQVYEINSKTTVLPPYPITLDGFTSEGGTKLQVQITSSDITRAQYPVLLKLVIKGNGITIESKSLFVGDPVYVNGNEITLLNGSDLAVFFNPDNLNFSGYSKTQYQRNGRLPEGVYSVSFELYDEFRARQNIFINVARALPGMVFMFLNEVPSLNLPMNNEVISAAGTPSINFRWTTRHSPLAATFFTPQYLFELWDVVPQGTNPYQVIRGTRPFFATTCEATYLTYGIAETPLQPGHTYAWRIREVDPEGKTMFKNDGYTEVYTFTYGRNCPAPELSADKTGTSHFSVTWQADPSQKQFELRIRDKKKKDAEWYTLKSGLLSAKVDQLKPNTIYEAEVCAICGDQRSEYSNRLEITTRQNTSFNCGQADSSKLPQNQNPLRKLSKGDVFTASTFTVEVSEASGSNGTFTGKGFILVPYLNFIKVEAKFQNIRINEEYQLIGGEVQTVYNISNSLTAKIDGIVKTIQGDGELNPYDSKPIAGKIIKVDSVKTIRVVNGQVIVIDVNGKEETATLAKDKLVVVKTQEGSQYVVDGATNTIYTSTNSGQKSAGGTPAGNITTATEAGKGNTPQFNLSFLPHTLQNYGYDIPSDKSPAENYESTNITGQPTLVPWKSLEAGRTEYVMAGITGGPADSIRYYRESNNMVMTAPGTSSNVLNGKTAPGQEFKQLLLTGTVENTTDKLFAWYPSDNDDTTKTYSRILAGQLNMASYEKKTIQVVLVPVNKSICPDPLYVEKELNRIYQSAVIDWNVTQMAAIDATFAGPVFDNTSPKEHLDYTPDMERVINQFKSSDAYSRDKFYLFFLDNAKDPNIKGFMPFKKQFGFIFKYQQYPDEYMRTIAHELGHGALRLWHTFSSNNQYIQPEGSTNNLMDYVDRSKADSAILLNKYQWDWAHDPTWRIYAFEDQEEAEFSDNNCKLIFIHKYPDCPKKSLIYPGYKNSFQVPYELNWPLVNCKPTYWLKIGDGVKLGDEYDNNGKLKLSPVLIKLSSPISLSSYSETKSKENLITIDGDSPDKYFKRESPPIGIYEEKIEAWIKKHWKPSNNARTQSAQAIESLANAVLTNGELNPQKLFSFPDNVLYEVNYLSKDKRFSDIVYYNNSEISYWLWGFFAAKKFNFFTFNEALAFGMQYFDKPEYNPIRSNLIEDTPWKAKAMAEGWMSAMNTYYESNLNYSMNNICQISSNHLIDGVGFMDMMEVTLWVFAGNIANQSAKKITLKLGTEMLTTAYINWQMDVLIHMIGGMSYEEAVKNVDYADVAWEGMTAPIKKEDLSGSLDCVNAMIETYNKTKEFNFTTAGKMSLRCLLELAKSKLFEKYICKANSPYSKWLKEQFRNKTMRSIQEAIMKNFNCTYQDTYDIMRLIPAQLLDSSI